ncbi:hypothetical protein PYW07_017077 [Mythimna separata]|uniref:Cathepsin propeptide inhibitor domain-containing protein n=1 Tax=Mythimna separata TaxID=271217 RepID=A0AAD8DY62_MYTSE|nr:hypothetical protein PYW07_017077 [Mythimna separata]
MRSVSVVLLLAVAAMASVVPDTYIHRPHYDLSNAKVLFEDFIKEYNRIYKDEADKEAHFQAFVESLEVINELNAQNAGVIFDINNLADYIEEEQRSLYGLKEKETKPQN